MGGRLSFPSSSSSFPSSKEEPMMMSSNNDDNNKDHAQQQQQFSSNDSSQNNISSSKQKQKHRTIRIINAFWSMTKIYFVENIHGRWMFFWLIILMILNSTVRVLFSYLARDFWTALSDQDVDGFYLILRKFLIALLFLAPINVFFRYQKQRLAIKWRKWMTLRLLNLYNTNRVFYKLERSNQNQAEDNNNNNNDNNTRDDDNNNVDNPDQRIAQDVRSFTQYSLSLFITITVPLIDLTAFSIILYTIKPQLFISIIGFALFGTVITILIGKKLVRINFDRLQKEADFRYSLVRFRDNVESIAFFGGENIETNVIKNRFFNVITNAYDLIGTQRNLDFFTTLYNYLTWILPICVIAPDYFNGTVELGVIQQAAAAFGHVLDDMSIIINEFESLTEFSASIGRLHQFVRAVQDADPDRDDSTPLLGRHVNVVDDTSSSKPPPPGGDDDDDGGNSGVDGGNISGRRRSKRSSVGSGDGIFKTSSKDVEENSHPSSKVSAVPTIDLIESPALSSSSLRTNLVSSSSSPITPQQKQEPISQPLPVPYPPHLPLSIHNLKLCTPDNTRILIPNLTLDLQWNQNLLIVGASGVGKSSLLRAIAGLWTSGEGTIKRANISDIYFVPQKPYCPLGSLRDQLLYPCCSIGQQEQDGENRKQQQQKSGSKSNDEGGNASDYVLHTSTDHPHNKHNEDDQKKVNYKTDKELLDILESIDLMEVANRAGDGNPYRGLDRVLDWTNTLSLGEQQRLSFGRILANQPKLVIMDESTSAMDVAAETNMYQLLRNTATTNSNKESSSPNKNNFGITYISVGHRPTLLKHHDLRLHLNKTDNVCTIDPITGALASEGTVTEKELHSFYS